MSDETNTAPAVDETTPPAETTTEAPAAPEPAPEQEKPSSSAREAIERAFAKVAEEPGRERDEKGRFKAKAESPEAPPAPESPPPVETENAVTESLKPAPAGFTPAAQAEWAKTPPAVQADVERRITELTTGLEQYKAKATELEPINKYVEMAKQSGTTLDQALERYTGMESRLRSDPVGGMFAICHNMGFDPRQMVAAMVQAVNGQRPNVVRPQGDTPEVQALKTKLAEFEKQFGELKSTLTESQAQSQIEKFAADKPYFSELEESMAHMLETGFAKNLSDAYDKALLLNPAVSAKIAADKASKEKPKQPDPAQTREKASLSTTGSPSAGSTPGTRKPPGSARESLQNAFAQLNIT